MPAAVSRQLISFGSFEFDPTSGLLFEGDQETLLPPKAAGVLRVLLECAGELVTKDELLESVWAGSFVTESSLTDNVSLLRQVLGDDSQDPTFIQTIHRRGYRFIADVEVERAGAPAVGDGAAAGVSTPKRSRIPRGIAAGAAVVTVIAGAFLIYRVMGPAPPETRPIRRYSMGLTLRPSTNWERPALALSPDGTHLVYSSRVDLYLRPMAEMEATEVPETGPDAGTSWGGAAPFFSPDGQLFGYFQDDRLMVQPLDAGSSEPLCVEERSFGAIWSPGGDSIVYGQGPNGIWRVSVDGGEPERLIQLEPGQSAYGPSILPGGEWLLFTLKSGGGRWDEAQIVAESLETGDRKELVSRGTDGRYVPTGHLVYARHQTLYAVVFDVERVETSGSAVAVQEGVAQSGGDITGAAHFSFSRTGDLVYLTPWRRVSHLYWVDRQGGLTHLAEKEGSLALPRLSPGGERVAAWVRDETGDHIWIYEIASDRWQPLTTEGVNKSPMWSPDGAWVVFSSDRLLTEESLYRRRADFSGSAELLVDLEGRQFARDFSSDGRLLLYNHSSPYVDPEIWLLHMDDDPPRPEALLQNPARESAYGFSPDRQWIAYQSDNRVVDEAYVRAYPGPGGPWQISNGGGSWFRWSPDGQEVFYWHNGRMMSVEVQTEPEFIAEPPRELFERDERISPGLFDVTPDGQRFLVYGRELVGARPQINVVTNWFEELKRNVPTGR